MTSVITRSNTLDWLMQVTYTTLRLFQKNGLQNQAAATAFYFLLSTTPLLLLLSYALQGLAHLAETFAPATMLLAALYDQLHLDVLTSMGFIPQRARLGAGGVGLLTLLLSSRGLVGAIQGAFRVIFPDEIKRRFVTRWALPLIIIPVAFLLMGLAAVAQVALNFFSSVEIIGSGQAWLLKGLNFAFSLLIAWTLIFIAYWQMPRPRPPARSAALVAALSAASMFFLFATFGYFFNLQKYKSLYGALGGVVFILIGAYFACLLFLIWAQFLFALTKADVSALEKLFVGNIRSPENKVEAYVFSRSNRLLDKYGQTFKAGETLIHEGEYTKTSFLLFAGRVGIYKEGADQRKKLGTLQEGELFGEMAYLLNEPRTATVIAETDVTALVLSPELLEELMRYSAPLSRHIIDTLCQRLERMNEALKAKTS
ncbi:MAG TPA: YhjD/YihY/BrkB family envelope integrity protein [Thiobacillaceae bacterium]|nr:YhjD/YihY/BrkB family envelope integrity protein [Thiobacillaceae bacterium]